MVKTLILASIVASVLSDDRTAVVPVEPSSMTDTPKLRRRLAHASKTAQGDRSSGAGFTILDPRTVEVKTHQTTVPLKRRFVSYSSSEWEQLWLDNVDEWAEKREICDVLLNEQSRYVHDFLNLTCTARYVEPYDNWCIIDDGFRPLWYDTANRMEFDLSWERPVPQGIPFSSPARPIIPDKSHEHIVSRFVFMDETTGDVSIEYIEPLVSHLRWPLCKCVKPKPGDDRAYYPWHSITFKGYIIPPNPDTARERTLLFDVGASTWTDPSSGASLRYFWDIYQRAGISIDEMYAWEMLTSAHDFYQTVPDRLRSMVFYRQATVSSHARENSEKHPFVPSFIKRAARPNDYTILKLDMDAPHVEDAIIEFILADDDNHIDEIAWEHHIRGNYLMEEWGEPNNLAPFSMRAVVLRCGKRGSEHIHGFRPSAGYNPIDDVEPLVPGDNSWFCEIGKPFSSQF